MRLVSTIGSWLRWRIRGKGTFDSVPYRVHSGSYRCIALGSSSPLDDVETVIVTAPGTYRAFGAARALAAELQARGADLAYSDSAVIDGLSAVPVHKPQWSPNLLCSGPYIGPAFAVRRNLLEAAGGLDQGGHALMLRLLPLVDVVAHVDAIWFASHTAFGFTADPTAAAAALERRGLRAVSARRGENWVSAHLDPVHQRSVGIVIPTRNGGARLGSLIDQLTTSTTYQDTHIIVVDNGSNDAVTAPMLARLAAAGALTVLDHPGPFNFSAICNRALELIEAELTLFLNDDVMIVDSRWLDQLVANLDDPSVGAVGAALVFPDSRIQHVGIVRGLGGVAGHPFRGRRFDDDGYFGWAGARREVGALSAACMLLRTSDALALNGFDENLPTDFQDVDLCLRLHETGAACIVDPVARLIHLESATRGSIEDNAEAAAYLRAKWGASGFQDPWYSRRLPLQNPGYRGSAKP